MAETLTRFEIADLENAIRNLKAAFPSLAEDEDFLADVLEGETDLFAVVGKLVDQSREQRAQAVAVECMIDTLFSRVEMWKARETATRLLILKLLNLAGVRKVALPQATVSIANGRKGVAIVNEEAVPDEFCSFKRIVSKTKVKLALDAGQDVPGAAISNGEETLTIR